MVTGKSSSKELHFGHLDAASISAAHNLYIDSDKDHLRYAVLDRKANSCVFLSDQENGGGGKCASEEVERQQNKKEPSRIRPIQEG